MADYGLVADLFKVGYAHYFSLLDHVHFAQSNLSHTILRDWSLFSAWGTEDFSGDHLIFRRTKWGSLKTLEGFRGWGGPLKFAWKIKTLWGGGGAGLKFSD